MTTTMTDMATGKTYVLNEALPGRDAYEEALLEGFTGSRADWLASLKALDFDPANPAWEIDRAYGPRAAVTHANSFWYATSPTQGEEPGTGSAWGKLLHGEDAAALTDALAEMQAAILQASGFRDETETLMVQALGAQSGAETAQGHSAASAAAAAVSENNADLSRDQAESHMVAAQAAASSAETARQASDDARDAAQAHEAGAANAQAGAQAARDGSEAARDEAEATRVSMVEAFNDHLSTSTQHLIGAVEGTVAQAEGHADDARSWAEAADQTLSAAVWLTAETDQTVTLKVGSAVVVSADGPGPFDSIILEIPNTHHS